MKRVVCLLLSLILLLGLLPTALAADGEETPGPIALRVGGKEIDEGAVTEEGQVYLPLIETGKAHWCGSSVG